jgi:hypothetical protein
MLGKLLKNELKATGRIFIPFYGALLILTIFTKLALAIGAPDFFSDNVSTNPVAEIILTVCFSLYAILVIALSVMTLVIIIQRFYKNLFTDEGYLMFTLAVKTWELILSKLLVGMIWSFICLLMIVISCIVLSLGTFTMMNLTEIIQNAYFDFHNEFNMNLNILLWELVLSAVVNTIASILMIYMSIAIGHLFRQHPIVASFGAFIAVTILLQILGSIFMAFFAVGNLETQLNQNSQAMETIQIFINGSTLCNVILCGIFYFITQYIMEHRLNLD